MTPRSVILALVAVTVVLGAAVAWQALRVATLEGRIVGLESRLAAVEAAPAPVLAWPFPTPAGGGRPTWAPPAAPGASPGVAPAPRITAPGEPMGTGVAMAGETPDQAHDRLVAMVRDEVEAFVAQEGLEPATADEIVRVFDDVYTLGFVIRDDVGSGRMTVPEARDEMITARADAEAYLNDLLGPDRYARLMERFPGQHGAGKP